MVTRIFAAAIALLCVVTNARAAAFPRLDVARSCHAATTGTHRARISDGKRQHTLSTTTQRIFASCMKDEAAARKAALSIWPHVKPADRRTCAGLSAMIYPSYVELGTCLDMAKQAADGKLRAQIR